MEITKTVELKNFVRLVMKNIWSSFNPVWKNMLQVHKISYKQIVPVLFQCFLKVLE